MQLLVEVADQLGDTRLKQAALKRLVTLMPDAGTVQHKAGRDLVRLARQQRVTGDDGPGSVNGATNVSWTKPADAKSTIILAGHSEPADPLRLQAAEAACESEFGLAAMRRAVELEPRNTEFIQSLFGALLEDGRSDEAAIVLRDALQANPRDRELPMIAARFHEARGNETAAIKSYDQALANAPGNRLWQRQRGMCHYRNGNFIQAAKDLSLALVQTPVRPQMAEFQAWVESNLQTGDYAGAERALKLISDDDCETAETEMLRGLCLLKQDRLRDAAGIVVAARAKWPGHAGLRRVAGMIDSANAKGQPE